MAPHLKAIQEGYAPQPVRQELVALGERFQIMTRFTSFVAVEKSRLTIGGKPVLVAVPIELPEGVSYEGVFGEYDKKQRRGEVAAGGTIAFPWQQGTGSQDAQLRRRVSGLTSETAEIPGEVTSAGIRVLQEPAVLGDRSTAAVERYVERYGRLDAPAAAPPPRGTPARSRGKRDAPGKGGGGFGGGGSAGGRGAEPERLGRKVASEPAAPRPDDAGAPIDFKESVLDSPTASETADRLYSGQEAQKRAEADDEARDPEAIDDGTIEAMRQVLLGRLEQTTAPHGVVLEIERLHRQGSLVPARVTAAGLARARPDYELGIGMHEVLTDDALEQEQRLAKVTKVADQARRALRARRVLDPALLAMTEGRPLVTVLVTKVDDETTRALTEAGLNIEAASKSLPIVVGTVDVANLEQLALLSVVRRIEPTRM
jgi:hypothetical protein